MKLKFIIYFSILFYSCSSVRYNKDVYKILTCKVSQTSTSCDVYSIDVFSDRSLKVTFGEKDINEDKYLLIFEEKKLMLTKRDFKKIKDLKGKITHLNEFDKKCMEKGGWQIDIYIDGKIFNFCNGEQLNTPLNELYQEVKRLSPVTLDLHSGGCSN